MSTSTKLNFHLLALLYHVAHCQLQGSLEGSIACSDSILGYVSTVFPSSWKAYNFDVTASSQEITFSNCNYNDVDPLWSTRFVLYDDSESQIGDVCDYLSGSAPVGTCTRCPADINLDMWTITLSSGSYYIEVQGVQASGNFRLDMDCVTDHPTALPTNIPTNHPTNIPTNHPTNIPTSNPTSIPTGLPTTSNPTTAIPTTTHPTTGTPTTSTTEDDGAEVDAITTIDPTIPNGQQNLQNTNAMDPILIALIVIGLFLFIMIVGIVGYYWLKKNRTSQKEIVKMAEEMNSSENVISVELTTVDPNINANTLDTTIVQSTDKMNLQEEDEDLYIGPGDKVTVTAGGDLQDYETPKNDSEHMNEGNDVTEGEMQDLDVTLGSTISNDNIENTEDDLYSKPVDTTKQ